MGGRLILLGGTCLPHPPPPPTSHLAFSCFPLSYLQTSIVQRSNSINVSSLPLITYSLLLVFCVNWRLRGQWSLTTQNSLRQTDAADSTGQFAKKKDKSKVIITFVTNTQTTLLLIGFRILTQSVRLLICNQLVQLTFFLPLVAERFVAKVFQTLCSYALKSMLDTCDGMVNKTIKVFKWLNLVNKVCLEQIYYS